MLIQKLLKKETIVESARILLIFTIIQKIIQTVRGIIFARLLGPSEYGVFTLAFFFIPLVVTIAKLGIPSCYERYVPQYEKKGELGDFFRRNYLLTIGAGILFTVLSLSFSKQISKVLYASTDYKNIIILSVLTIIPVVLYEGFVSSFNGLRFFKMGALLRFSQFFIFTTLGIALVIFYPKAKSAILANFVSFIFVSFLFGLIIWKYILNSDSQHSKIQEDNFYSKIFKYSIWFIVAPVVSALFRYTDRWMLNHFLGLDEVGIYSVSANITQIVFMVGMITGNVLMPNLSNIWERGEKDRAMFILNLTIKFITLCGLCYAVIFVLFKKQVIFILYGTKYLEGLPIIAIFLMFWLFNTIFWIVGIYPNLIEKPYLFLVANVPGVALNIVLNYILIPIYGIMGAAISTTIAYVFILIVLFLLYKKEKMELDLKTIFVCMTPFILLLNNILMILSFLILLVGAVKGHFIVTKEEKVELVQQLRKLSR